MAHSREGSARTRCGCRKRAQTASAGARSTWRPMAPRHGKAVCWIARDGCEQGRQWDGRSRCSSRFARVERRCR
ncbi:hypothetical protein BD311DRAFT_766886 [Dichomitus squalens]|uniref:Uncharacterized protein n=1 Tax=Dichomitus squalens TaxID=114155 RepID=A0A4Q9MAL8_9APHY|nr:hypothetical protein BD311DRAFT_766886 [Dichomitus squalens]